MINKTIVQGRLVADPDLRHTPSDVAVASFRVAWSEKYKETETKLYLTCTAWHGTAEAIAKHFTKGKEIIVSGKLSTRSYEDKEGQKRSSTELTVDEFSFCGKKDDSGAAPSSTSYSAADTSNFEELGPNDDFPF